LDCKNRHRMPATLTPGSNTEDLLSAKDLGPRLHELEKSLPTWPVAELPHRKHSRFGVTCTRMSRGGRTKRVGWHNQQGMSRELEVCPCGARRQVIDGEPEAGWSDINAALKDPRWPTIRRATT
jgi:hypothetical protein